MPYIGRPLNAGNLAVQSGTGDGSDTTPIATLDYSVGSSNSIGVYLDGVRQLAGTDFTASGTVLTFTTAPANGVGVDVYFLGLELSIPTPGDATVTTAKIAANAVDETKLKDALVADFTEVTVAAGDSILLGDATDSGNTKRDTVQGLLDLVPASITLGTTIASTSGTAIDFTGIPAGTKKIFIMFTGVSTSATDYLLIQLGDSGGFETSGYVSTTAEFIGSTSVATDTTGFEMATGVAAGLVSGHMILTLSKADTFSWVSSHVAGFTNDVVVGGGHKSLSAELTQIRIDTNGSDTFDAGAINISYE
jgi:hypothetical protein